MSSNSEVFDISFLSGSNAAFIEDLYDRYAADPNSVDESWRTLFSSLGKGVTAFKPAWALSNRTLFSTRRRPTPRTRPCRRPCTPCSTSP